MADQKISTFTNASVLNTTDKLTGLQGGANVNWTGTLLETFISRVGGTVAVALGLKAPLASPTFTGTPMVPTAAPGTNTAQAASTAFVDNAISSVTGSDGRPALVAFGTTLPHNGYKYMHGDAADGPHTFVPDTGTAEDMGMCIVIYKADGSGAPDTSAYNDRNGGITNYDDTPNMLNELVAVRERSKYFISCTPLVEETVDTTPPTLLSRTAINRDTIRIVGDEPITAASAAGLTASIGGGPITAVAIYTVSGTTLDIAFPALSFATGDTITLSASGANTIIDANSNALVAFSGAAVTNLADSVAPTIASVTVEDATPDELDIEWDEAVDPASISAAAAFAVTGGHALIAHNYVDATHTKLVTSTAFVSGEVATLGYTQPVSNKMKDLAVPANLVATVSGVTIDNNVGAAPVTLNQVTGFTAGTPTAGGCPSTWTDTNASPNELSFLIQIAAGADTSFTTILDTRTPAANATSDAGGTALSPLTAYRMRIIPKGNGTTILDGPPSTAVTFTTAAAAVDLTFSSTSGSFTESPTGTFNLGMDAYGVADQILNIGQRVYATVGATDNEVLVIGADDDATLEHYSPPAWSGYVFMYTGTYQLNGEIHPGGALFDTGVAYAAGHKIGYRLADVSGATKLIACYHNGSTWIDLHTFGNDFPASTGRIKVESSLAATKLINPKIEAV